MKHISRIVNQSKYVQSVNYLFFPPPPEFSQNNQEKAYLWIVAEQNHLSRLQKYADKILLSEQNPHTFAYQWTDLSAIVKSFDLALQWGFWAILIVLYAILAMFWNSLTQPIPICLVTLFSYGGAIVTLSLFDLSWSIPSFFGLCLSLSINTGHMMHFWADAESRRRASGDLLQAIHQSSRKYFFPVCSYTIIWSIAFLGVFVLAPAPIRDFYWPMFHGFIGPTYVTTIMMIFGLPHLFRAFYNSSASHKVNVVYQSIETTV
jgi:multidrug efflux pump subunit AcrB